MEREGFEVAEARNGHEALEMTANQPFDLVLMDVNMPGIDGFEVIKQLREHEETSRVPVILITAHATTSGDVAHGLGLGADDYIRKPFDPRELAARARTKIKAYHLEESLKRRTEELEALVHIGEELNESLDLDALIRHILEAAAREIPADNAVLILYDRDLAFKRLSILEEIPRLADDAARCTLADQLKDISSAGWEDETDTTRELLHLYGYQSVAWATLYHHGRKMGILALVHRETGVYDDDALRLLQSIAKQATLAIRNAELYEEQRDYAENLEEKVKARTAELQAAQESLIRSEKLASLGRLSAGIAHEFNNPLQAILTCLNMAIEDITGGAPVDLEMLQVAEQHVSRISKITRGLLTFARQDEHTYEQIDLNALLTETFILTRKQMQNSGVVLEIDLEPLPAIHAIADRLRQVFVNLTLNAIEAMPEGGTLRVGTRVSGDFAVIFFEDTGVGITPENQARLFEPFFSTKGENGTGLGLSLSYGIVEGHGGTIQVESVPGQGTTFYIWLPITQEAHEIPKELPAKLKGPVPVS